MRPFTLLSTVFLGLLSLAHLVRALLGVEILVGSLRIPVWASLPAFLFTGALAALLAWEHRKG